MDIIYWIIIGTLFVLSIFGLMVGVTNDAVNFLNSAIGSRVAPYKTILIVASCGILIGSFMSSGMMEVARSGVFVPGEFHFHSVMMLFLAVMISNVVLLDIYNTFGLPTSTTVALVFSLLGAALAVAWFELAKRPEGVSSLGDFIQSAKALQMISGILSSVVIAFVCGTIVMYVSRIIFSFHYLKMFRIVGSLWCGISLTTITYFAIFKGLKGSSFVTAEQFAYLNEHIWAATGIAFIGWSVFMFILQHIFRVNILKVIILVGTFTLALAFAGNDLVNFIGVFMASNSAFETAADFVASGGNLQDLKMSSLAAPVMADWRYLFGAGVVMIVALWFSKKARSVSDTEVNLAKDSDDSIERFGSVPPARSIVRYCVNLGKWVDSVMPPGLASAINKRFIPLTREEREKAPFDLIRASVNLTVASLLISMATSLKLPLSTTYVTFMVAMGSSLADRAWGRESAVYRVTGVLTVISGWFMTAFLASLAAALIAALLMYGGVYAIVGMVVLVAFIMIKSSLLHKKMDEKKKETTSTPTDICEKSVIERCTQDMLDAMKRIITIYSGTIDAIFNEDRKALQGFSEEASEFRALIKDRRKYELVPTLKALEAEKVDTAHYYVRVLDYLNEVSKSLLDFAKSSQAYIDNTHSGFNEEQLADLRAVNEPMIKVYQGFAEAVKKNDYKHLSNVLIARDELFSLFGEAIRRQVKRARNPEIGSRNSMLYMDLLNEAKNMALQTRSLIKAQRYLMQPQHKRANFEADALD